MLKNIPITLYILEEVSFYIYHVKWTYAPYIFFVNIKSKIQIWY